MTAIGSLIAGIIVAVLVWAICSIFGIPLAPYIAVAVGGTVGLLVYDPE